MRYIFYYLAFLVVITLTICGLFSQPDKGGNVISISANQLVQNVPASDIYRNRAGESIERIRHPYSHGSPPSKIEDREGNEYFRIN